MSYFDDASLVFIPSGTKVSKAYSVKPIDGSGDLAFTRSNDTATRVQSNGLIEKVRTNLVLNSATFVTQTITVGANPYTISFTGTGTIVITGTGSGTLVGTGAANRVSLSFTATAGALILTGTGTVTLAQLETGDIATDYIPTTSVAVSVGPVANVPRLDYLNSTCPKLLLEPQRTNLITFSEQLDNAAWTQGRLATTANTQASPSGTISADTITDTVTSGTHRIYTTGDISVVSGTSYAASCFVKAGTSTTVELRIMSNTESDIGITGTVFNLSNGTIVSGSGSIEDYGNGWYRCTNTGTSNTTGNAKQFIYLYNSINQKSYLGTGTNTLFLWGAQLEAAAYPTSYIPTLSASVTRGADAASKTGISSLIGQTQGVLYAEINLTKVGSGRFLSINSGLTSERILLAINSTNTLSLLVVNSGAQASLTTAVLSLGTHKVAAAYNLNDFVLYVDGVQIGTDNSGTVPACSDINVGNELNANQFGDGVSQALLFKTRLTNAQLAELTTI